MDEKMKYCKYCGGQIPEDAVMCTLCGRQVETLRNEQPQVIVNNTNANTNVNNNTNTNAGYRGRRIDKWVSFILCACLGYFGAHKFYEGNVGMGLLYLFTGGLGGIG